MGNGLNRVYILGNVGQNPRLTKFDDGGGSLGFSLATNEDYKDRDGEMKKHTEWHNVVVKGKRAIGLSDHVKKGTGLLIVGRLRTRKWEKDGVQHYTTEVMADEVRFTGGRRDDDGESDGEGRSRESHDHGDSGGGQATGGADKYEDDIPF